MILYTLSGCIVEGPVDTAFDDAVPDVLSILKVKNNELNRISEKSDGLADDANKTKKISHRDGNEMEDFKLVLPRHRSMDIKTSQLIEESPMEVKNFSDDLV